LFDVATSYRVGESTAGQIVRRVCTALWDQLQPMYLAEPNRSTWLQSAAGFQSKWQFPHCCGAIDGKHVVIQAPGKSGSLYYNCNGTYSIVLMVVVDYDYNFMTVDVGSYGRNSDGGIFRNSVLGDRLLHGRMEIPAAETLPNAQDIGPLPYCLVGDESFPLSSFMMRPYPGRGLTTEKRIFNYRLSRARRIVENAFGILSARWRIYRRVINLKPENVDKVIKATVVLHNFLRKTDPSKQSPSCTGPSCGDLSDDQSTDVTGAAAALQSIDRLSNCTSTAAAVKVRNAFMQYFNSMEGSVAWQSAAIGQNI